jgi:HD-like signal output (HDOD) protein
MSDPVAKVEPKQCATCKRVFASESDYLTGTHRWRICDRKNLWFNCNCGSTMMIIKGKFDWYSPDKTMSSGAAGLFNKIGSLKELPHVSTSVMEIQEKLQAADLDVPLVARKMKGDPLLAGMLLATANNIKMSRDPKDRLKIEGLEHAIMYVGKKACSELVMTISLKAFHTATKIFNADAFWKEAFVTAELAELIAFKWGAGINRDEVFISAALCNIGKIVGAIAVPQTIDKIETMVNNPSTLCTWPQAESILKLPSHTLLGEIGAAMWGLPKYVLEAVASHHDIKVSARDVPKLTLVESVALANQVCHWILLKPSRIDEPLLKKLCEIAKISTGELEAFTELHSKLGQRAA